MEKSSIDYKRHDLPKGMPDDAHLVENTYECPCGETWQDIWDCGVDDDCEACGLTISPSDTRDISDCACPRCKVDDLVAPASHLAGVSTVLSLVDEFLSGWEDDAFEGGDASDIRRWRQKRVEVRQTRGFILAAAEAFTVQHCADVHRQLGIAAEALERARDVLSTASETLVEPLDGEAEAVAQDCVEGLNFVRAVLDRVPQVLPVPVAIGQTQPVQEALQVEAEIGRALLDVARIEPHASAVLGIVRREIDDPGCIKRELNEAARAALHRRPDLHALDNARYPQDAPDLGEGSRSQSFAGQPQEPFQARDGVVWIKGNVFCSAGGDDIGIQRAKLIALALNAHPEGRLAATLRVAVTSRIGGEA